MIKRNIIFLPHFGANDESAIIVEWQIKDGDMVRIGDVLCIAETSKTAFDIESKHEGYFFLLAKEGEAVKTGKPIAVLSSNSRDSFESIAEWLLKSELEEEQFSTVTKATKKALMLSEKLGININEIPFSGKKLSEEDVIEYSSKIEKKNDPVEIKELVHEQYTDNKCNKILILTGGSGAVLAIDTISTKNNQEAVGILDDTPKLVGKTIVGIPIWGPIEEVFQLHKKNIFDGAIIPLGSNLLQKKKMFCKLKNSGIPFANVIHSSAIISNNVKMGEGNIILPNCHIGPFATIGDNNYFAASVNIDHDNIIGSHCRFGPGVMLSGNITVSDQVQFGTGVFIEPGLTIGEKSILESGTIITKNVPPNSIVKSAASITTQQRHKSEE